MYAIRKATADDAQTIRDLAEKTWWDAYSPILEEEQISFMLNEIYDVEKLRHQLENNIQTFLILTEGDKPVGFAAFSPREVNPEVYKLHKLYCLPETQGKGYGKVMINEVIKQNQKGVAKCSKSVAFPQLFRSIFQRTCYTCSQCH